MGGDGGRGERGQREGTGERVKRGSGREWGKGMGEGGWGWQLGRRSGASGGVGPARRFLTSNFSEPAQRQDAGSK